MTNDILLGRLSTMLLLGVISISISWTDSMLITLVDDTLNNYNEVEDR